MQKIFNLILLAVLTLSSCTKTETSDPIESQQFTINSTSSTSWKYFSFSRNDTVSIADPMNSLEWDLAFQRYRIRTNSGTSGNGEGSAANSYKKLQAGFDLLTLIPDTTTFKPDQTIQIAVQQGYASYDVNPVLYTWFNIELGANGTQIIPSDYVYIVKTATGKYAKVWFKSYYSTENASGYVTIQYKYQPDGTKNLQ
jgi:HmuY protein